MWLDKIMSRLKDFFTDIIENVVDFFEFADIDDYFMLFLQV